MNVVIAGGGKVGSTICNELADNHDVVLIEHRQKVLEKAINKYDITGLVGNGANYETQVDAGVKDCDIFIAVTPKDEINIIAATIAKRIGATHTIARVRNPEYAGHSEFMRRGLGISMMINPELEAAKNISLVLNFAEAVSVEQFVNEKVNIVELIATNDTLIGTPLLDFRDKFGDVLVCAILRKEEVIIPSGQAEIQKDDHLFVTGSNADLTKLYRRSGLKEDKIRTALIVGGGRVAHYLLEMHPERRIDIKIIEQDEEKALELSEAFPDVVVINGDGSDQDLLKEERISSFDAVVTLTGGDEENILISLFALKQNVHKAITKVSRTDLLSLLDLSGFQSFVTPKHLIANKILRFIRSLNSNDRSNMEALFRIADNKVEAIQFRIPSGAELLNKSLQELTFKENILIAAIVRGKKLIFPSGYDEIKENDRMIVVTTQKNITNVDDILL